MGYPTQIEWTDATWNPFGGCSVTSPGCTNCYAMRIAGSPRLRNHPLYAGVTSPSKAGPVFNGTLTVADDAADVWTWPLRWRGAKEPKLGAGKPSMIFVGDMADLFHESRPDEVIDRVFAVMALAPQHIFQVLTKRPERMRAYIADCGRFMGRQHEIREAIVALGGGRDAPGVTHAMIRISGGPGLWRPLPNVWLGTSVEDQHAADERLGWLAATPSVIRFISTEPLLGLLNLRAVKIPPALRGLHFPLGHSMFDALHPAARGHIHQVIAGYESGPQARPRHPNIVRRIRDQCEETDTAFFFKQHGSWAPSISAFSARKPDIYVSPAGRTATEAEALADGGPHWHGMFRMPKKEAGHLLDGREHREFPA